MKYFAEKNGQETREKLDERIDRERIVIRLSLCFSRRQDNLEQASFSMPDATEPGKLKVCSPRNLQRRLS